MKQFMDKDFLLSTPTAQHLFHDYAAKMPILDYHCHINPKEIAEDRKFENITQVWLGGDHYKWRQMRTNGVDEKYITGDASDREKFQKWAETLEMAIGNPLYHWSHLELQRYFGYNGILNGDTAEEVWNLCNAKLQEDSMSVRNLIKQSNVTLVCTTDDPVDSLEWHQVLKDDKTFDVQVLPAWRPDKAMNIEKPEYLDYLETLSNVSGIKVNSFASLIDALRNRMDFFASMGCSVSDHALEYVMYKPYTEEEIEAIFAKRFSGSAITTEEMNKFKTAFMVSVGKEYNKRNWVMQLHYGTIRDNNRLRYDQLGPDTGYDCINTYDCSAEMAQFLNALNATDELPKTINNLAAAGSLYTDNAYFYKEMKKTDVKADLDRFIDNMDNKSALLSDYAELSKVFKEAVDNAQSENGTTDIAMLKQISNGINVMNALAGHNTFYLPYDKENGTRAIRLSVVENSENTGSFTVDTELENGSHVSVNARVQDNEITAYVLADNNISVVNTILSEVEDGLKQLGFAKVRLSTAKTETFPAQKNGADTGVQTRKLFAAAKVFVDRLR